MNIRSLNEELEKLYEVSYIVPGSEKSLRVELRDKLPKECTISSYTDTKPGPNNMDGIKITCPKDKEWELVQVLKPLKGKRIDEDLFSPELISKPSSPAKYNIGDKVRVNNKEYTIIEIRPLKMSPTPSYKLEDEAGNKIWAYEEEILNETIEEDEMNIRELNEELEILQEGNSIELFREKEHAGLDIELKETSRGFVVVSHLGGYNGDTYKPNFETSKLGSGKTWQAAIDNTVKKLAEENEDTDIVTDLLIAKEHFSNNEEGQYLLKGLEALEEMDESINEDKSYEEEVLDAFETVRGFIETTMQHIKLSSKPQNFVRLANSMNHLKMASDVYELAQEEKDEIERNRLLQSAYRQIQEAKRQFN